MKDIQTIQDELKEFPKYSLSNVQKQRVLLALKQQQTSTFIKKKSAFFKPLVSCVAIILVLFTLIISEYPNIKNWGSTSSNLNKNQVDLNAMEGDSFELENRYKVIGVQNKVALLDVFGNFVAEDKLRVAKLMVYFWGNPDELIGEEYRIEGMNSYGEKFLLSEGTLSAALYNEDAHTLTSFPPFRTDGKWKLSFFVGGNLHGEFTLNVLPPFPKTKHYTLSISPKELNINEESAITIEGSKDKNEIKVKLLNENGKIIKEKTFKQDSMVIDASTSEPVYLYNGELELPKKGTYSLSIDGEETTPFKN
jgi:hypothetical protein